MPRTKLGAEEYAKTDFLRHLSAQQHYHGFHTQRELGQAIGCCQGSVGQYLQRPDMIRIGVLRRLIKAVSLDPEEVLLFLGYSRKDIKQLREPARNE